MHYYSEQVSDHVDRLQAHLRDVEECAAVTEAALDAAYDEIEEGLHREQRLLWTALALGTLAAAAIMQLSWMMVGR